MSDEDDLTNSFQYRLFILTGSSHTEAIQKIRAQLAKNRKEIFLRDKIDEDAFRRVRNEAVGLRPNFRETRNN